MDDFTHEEIEALYKVMAARRDMRHFSSEPLPAELLQRLLIAAHLAPSVGLMQPWRFIRIRDRRLRERIHALVDEERARTAAALGEREEEFMRLKVEGILECGEVLVAGLAPDRDKHIFGRRTMPEMDLASVACAIQNMWLAARAEGVGMGWVSLFEPEALRELLRMPEGSQAGGGALSRPRAGVLPPPDARDEPVGAWRQPRERVAHRLLGRQRRRVTPCRACSGQSLARRPANAVRPYVPYR
jgi:5,6-dimethylbenzimidazole synthase